MTMTMTMTITVTITVTMTMTVTMTVTVTMTMTMTTTPEKLDDRDAPAGASFPSSHDKHLPRPILLQPTPGKTA
jgi:hypothetical protein